jgi:hypothetical protein
MATENWPQNASVRMNVEMVLSQYLASVEKEREIAETNVAGNTRTSDLRLSRERQKKEDGILRTVYFLYGKTLESALPILDASAYVTTITHLLSIPSQRSLYLVKGSSSYSKSRYRRGKSIKEVSYLCLVPRTTDDLPIYYCSCRSFLERTRPASAVSGGAVLCKHLLAIRLMPALGLKPSLVETMSDTEFSKIILQRMNI